MASEEHRRVLDPEQDTAALKALTHPLRIQLLGLLRLDGPATASELAARTGESSASTSYHLRVLAKYAFIAEAEHRDGRERRWRALHAVTSWSNAAMDSSAAGRALIGLSRRRQIEHLEESVARYEADASDGRLGPEWLEPSGIDDWMTRLTPESLAELRESYDRKLEELAARDAGDPRAEQIVLITARLPVAPRVSDPDTGTGTPSAVEPDTPAGPEPGSPAAAGPDTPDTPAAPEDLS